MTRALIFIAALQILFSAPASAADWPTVFEQRGNAIPLIDRNDHDYCSGIVINAEDGYVLTAAHCISEEARSYTVDRRDATVLRVNRELELAVIKTRLRTGATALPLAAAMPRAGSAVAVLGYPFSAQTLTIQVGIVANPAVDGMAWVNADLLPGDSGGAIVNERGELIAVTSGYRATKDGGAHIGRVVPIDTIRPFIEDLLPGASR